MKFNEFESLENQVIYVSATPADYELIKSEGSVVEQFIRPTGLVDPPVEVRPTLNQIDDLVEEIEIRAEADERVLVTTLTKRMAEELYKYFDRMGIRCRYIHSDVDTLERVQILDDLRAGLFDVLIAGGDHGRRQGGLSEKRAFADADRGARGAKRRRTGNYVCG